jgi:hypothetical protein
MIDLDSKPSPHALVQGQQFENEAVLVLPDKGEVKVLNEVGAQIWQLADGRRTVREIAAAIGADYAVTRSEVEADTLEFITELAAKGIVSIQT